MDSDEELLDLEYYGRSVDLFADFDEEVGLGNTDCELYSAPEGNCKKSNQFQLYQNCNELQNLQNMQNLLLARNQTSIQMRLMMKMTLVPKMKTASSQLDLQIPLWILLRYWDFLRLLQLQAVELQLLELRGIGFLHLHVWNFEKK